MLTVLFDADMLVYKACASVEEPIEWDNDLWTLHADAREAQMKVDDTVMTIMDKILNHKKYEGRYEIIMCFSDKENFRKKILPTYKLNRVGKRKPVCYFGVKKWVEEHYRCYQKPTLEADDCMGILATMHKDVVVVSGDKDFKTIPTTFYNYLSDEWQETTEEQANYWHLYQTLIGDTADNYKGCPSVGPVTALKILGENPTWQTVVKAFEKQGLTEADALVQARVARILRKSDYDFKTKKPILWTPK